MSERANERKVSTGTDHLEEDISNARLLVPITEALFECVAQLLVDRDQGRDVAKDDIDLLLGDIDVTDVGVAVQARQLHHWDVVMLYDITAA